MIICKYKFDSSIYSNLIPEFNSGYNGYSVNDIVDGNIITRTIECDTLPTLMRFGRAWVSGESTTDNRTDSLLEVLDMNTSGLADCSSMFRYCTNLTSINCEWNTGNVTSTRYMFADCNNLTSLDVSNFNTSNVTDMGYMFTNCTNLTQLDVSNFNTGNVTDMYSMFQNCKNLTQLDVSNWNTGNVTTMGYMFHSCHNLASLDVSNFITNNVTDMQSMFSKCSNLTTLDVSNFITSNVTNMHCMFRECQKLASLNVSNWNTSKVTDMGYIIYHCRSLKTLSLSSWNFDSVADTTEMFYNCVSLVTLDTPRIKVPIYGNNFFGELCPVKYIRVNNLDVINSIEPQLKYARTSDNPGYIITNIAISSIPTDTISALSSKNWTVVSDSTLTKVAEYVYDSKIWRSLIPEFNSEFIDWFIDDVEDGNGLVTRTISSMGGLPTLVRFGTLATDLSNINHSLFHSLIEVLYLKTDNVIDMNGMFRYCLNLTKVYTKGWDTSKVTHMAYMFCHCKSLTSLDVSNFDTSKVSNMVSMFNACTNLAQLDLSNFDTSKVKTMSYMFYECQSLTSLDLSNFDTSNVTAMQSMFSNCTNLTQLDVSNWNTSKVTDMNTMFGNCTNLTQLDVSNWNTSKVTTIYSIFFNCIKLINLNLSNWNTTSFTNLESMFNGCQSLQNLDISNFKLTSSMNIKNLFYNITSGVKNIGMLYCDKDTINLISSALNTIINRTIWVEGSMIDDLTSYDNITYKAYYYEKELLLNSPLLEGDKIVKKDGKIYHYHKMGKVVLDGSEDEEWRFDREFSATKCYSFFSKPNLCLSGNGNIGYCDTIPYIPTWSIGKTHTYVDTLNSEFPGMVVIEIKADLVEPTKEGICSWLQSNPTTVVYELANPYYELISEDKDLSLTLPSTDNILTNNSLIPTNMNVKNSSMSTVGISNSSTYTVVFDKDTDNNIVVNLNGTSIETSDNRVEITTSNELGENELTFIGEGEISNVRILDGSVSGDNIPRESFEGLKSSFEDGKLPNPLYTHLDEFTITRESSTWGHFTDSDSLFVNNRVYTLFMEVLENSLNNPLIWELTQTYTSSRLTVNPGQVGIFVGKVDTPGNSIDSTVWVSGANEQSSGEARIGRCYALEGDWTHLTVEDFEHLGKYKVEYKVTGKNKFNTNIVNSFEVNTEPYYYYTQYYFKDLMPNLVKGKRYKVYFDKQVTGQQNGTIGLAIVSPTFKEISEPFTYTKELDNKIIYVYGGRTIGTISNFRCIEVDSTTNTEYEEYKEYTKTFYLNSPLLEGDTIEDVNGVATHVKRYEKIVLDGSEDGWKNSGYSFEGYSSFYMGKPNNFYDKFICDKFTVMPFANWDNLASEFICSVYSDINIRILSTKVPPRDLQGFKSWLQANPTTVVYQLTSPIYEPISTESVLCDSYVNGHLDVDTNIPVEKVKFNHITRNLRYLTPSTKYRIQFNSDNAGVLNDLGIASKYIYTQNVIKGTNNFSITTPDTLPHTTLRLNGIGFNASNIQVVATDRDNIKYFKGMESSFEDCTAKSKNLFNKEIIFDYGIDQDGIVSSDSTVYSSEYIECKPNTPYICNYGTGIHYFDKDKRWISYLAYGTPSPSNAKYLVKCISKTANLNTVQIEEGVVVTGYEPYLFKYKVEVSMVGKNKWKYGDILNKDVYQVYLDEPLKKGNYVISSTCGQKYEFNPYIAFLNDEETIVGANLVKDGRLVNISKDINRIVIYSNGYDYAASSGKPMDFTDIQLEEGTTKTEYEPYKETRETIYLNSPLLKGDRIEMYNGKLCHYHKMGKVVLDGSEYWAVNEAFSSGDYIAYLGNAVLSDKKQGVLNIISDKFNTKNCALIPVLEEGMWGEADNSVLYISISKSKLSTQDVAGFKVWLQANPTTVVYELAEPYYEEITPEHNEFTIVSIGESSFTIDSGNVPADGEVTYNVNVKLLNDLEENMNSNTSSTNVDLTTILDDIINE